MKSRSRKRTPTIVNLTVKRRYLTEREVERLTDCARKYGRYGHRDATMILVAYRHGLRASEVCDLQWMRALRKLRREYARDRLPLDHLRALRLGLQRRLEVCCLQIRGTPRLTAQRPHREISHPLVMAPCASSACAPSPHPRCQQHP